VIRSFADRGTEDIFNGADTRAAHRTCPKLLWPGARRKLDQLNRVRDLRELAVPPGNRLERANTAFESISSIACVFNGRTDMRIKSKSRTITKRRPRVGKTSQSPVMRRLPTKRPPTHPGEMLLEEFLKPLGISQSAFAVRLGVSFPRLNEIIRRKRSITSDTALRLAQVLGTSADFWLGLQQDWDLWHALRSRKAAAIARLEPLRHVS
jgi:addiction module HigA family antidote